VGFCFLESGKEILASLRFQLRKYLSGSLKSLKSVFGLFWLCWVQIGFRVGFLNWFPEVLGVGFRRILWQGRRCGGRCTPNDLRWMRTFGRSDPSCEGTLEHEDSTQVTGGGQGNKRRGVAECKRQWRELVDVSCDIVW
jgi:hypothetical protein